MATGDELGVLMRSDLGVAGGAAAHDATAAAVSGLNAAKTGVPGKGENLLPNWCWIGGGSRNDTEALPIDQGAGLVLSPGVKYYSDDTLQTEAGTTDGYATILRANAGVGQIKIGEDVRYFDYTDASSEQKQQVGRGYANDLGARYCFDRWILVPEQIPGTDPAQYYNGAVILTMGYAIMTPHTQLACKLTEAQKAVLDGKQLTFTAAFADLSVISGAGTYHKSLTDGYVEYADDGKIALRVGADGNPYLVNRSDANAGIAAIKLELGAQQTLTYPVDANGAPDYGASPAGFALADPPPDYAAELASCQRFAVMLKEGTQGTGYTDVTGGANKYVHMAFPIPVPLRANGVLEGDLVAAAFCNGLKLSLTVTGGTAVYAEGDQLTVTAQAANAIDAHKSFTLELQNDVRVSAEA